MERIIEAEMEIKAKKDETAINRFFKKYSEIDYWKETFEYMVENGVEHFVNDLDNMGNKIDWSYSLWFIRSDDSVYMAVIERA